MKKETYFKKAKRIVINATANALSAPAQIKSKIAQKRADSDVAIIKRARAYDKSTSDDAVYARNAREFVKMRLNKNKKK